MSARGRSRSSSTHLPRRTARDGRGPPCAPDTTAVHDFAWQTRRPGSPSAAWIHRPPEGEQRWTARSGRPAAGHELRRSCVDLAHRHRPDGRTQPDRRGDPQCGRHHHEFLPVRRFGPYHLDHHPLTKPARAAPAQTGPGHSSRAHSSRHRTPALWESSERANSPCRRNLKLTPSETCPHLEAGRSGVLSVEDWG